jgi:RNA methyltransferase, TrmH family
LFLLEGEKVILDALAARVPLNDVFVGESAATRPSIEDAATSAGITPQVVSESVIRVLSETTTPQGCVAVARMPLRSLDEVGGDLVLVLAEVRDPGNAGTLVRSAVAAGAGFVVFSSGSVDPFGPKTVRASAGALFRTGIVRGVDLGDALQRLKDVGFASLAGDPHSRRTIEEVALDRPVAVVVGNEAWGVPEAAAALVTEFVGIPMPGPVESLNVAVAGSLLLFECIRKRAETKR